MIESKRLTFKKMKLEDVYQFKNWGEHKTALLDDYNFVEQTEKEIKDWYEWKTGQLNSLYFTIFLKENQRAIGYISFKDISKLLRTAELGIVLDPNYINQGYGYETLNRMLVFYFEEMKYNKIYLDVALYNKRAYYLYSKIGFVKVATSIMKYTNGKLDKTSNDYLENKDVFVNILGFVFFKKDRMVLTKERFERI